MPVVPRFRIRDATESDLSHIRARLPDALGGLPLPRIGLAIDEATGAIAGFASLRVFSDHGGRFLIFVEPAFRRRGCGTLLLETVRQLAPRVGVNYLLTARSYPEAAVDEDTAVALAFVRARGMSIGQDVLGYRADIAAALALLEPRYRRSLRKAEHFQRTRFVTADQVDSEAIAAFTVQHVGGDPEDIAQRINGHRNAFFLPTSVVALQDHRVVGTLLTIAKGQTAFIEARAVASAHRGSWINLALMHFSAATGNSLGFEVFEFEGEAQDRDTCKLAARLRATQVARRQRWVCPIEQ